MADSKPSNTEDEYFAREDAERLRKIAAENRKALAEAERESLQKLHYMRCPKCGMELKTITFRSVEIDRCFSCNGTWLDAGELEKLSAKGGQLMEAVMNLFSAPKKK